MFNIEENKAKQELENINDLSEACMRSVIGYKDDTYKLFWYGEADVMDKIALLGKAEVDKMFRIHELTEKFVYDVNQVLGREYTPKGIPEGYTKDSDGNIVKVEE